MPACGTLNGPLKPGVNTARMESVVAHAKAACFGLRRHNILANRADIIFGIHDLNNGARIDLLRRWANDDRFHVAGERGRNHAEKRIQKVYTCRGCYKGLIDQCIKPMCANGGGEYCRGAARIISVTIKMHLEFCGG